MQTHPKHKGKALAYGEVSNIEHGCLFLVAMPGAPFVASLIHAFSSLQELEYSECPATNHRSLAG